MNQRLTNLFLDLVLLPLRFLLLTPLLAAFALLLPEEDVFFLLRLPGKKGMVIADIITFLYICAHLGILSCAVFRHTRALTGRASATVCGTRCEVTHVHGGVEASYHSVDSLIQPRRLDQICGSQLVRICLNYFNAWKSH